MDIKIQSHQNLLALFGLCDITYIRHYKTYKTPFKSISSIPKHVQDIADDNFSRALEWLVERNDPKIICHSAVVLFADLLWTRMAQHPGLQ